MAVPRAAHDHQLGAYRAPNETGVTIGVMHAQCLKETTCNNASLLFCKRFHREPLSDTVSLQVRGRANLRR
jgi:hypothetical protein